MNSDWRHTDEELEKIKLMLEDNMTDFPDVTVLVTNKDFKYKQLSDEAWSELEKTRVGLFVDLRPFIVSSDLGRPFHL